MDATSSPPESTATMSESETDGDADAMAAYNSLTGNEDLLANVRQHVERERQTVQEKNKLIRQQLEVYTS